ncbi:hypothetical protein [Gordonibacter massiliensis (ex Traore et al. 2017)]|uniref:hypothetical protein n=1 Tax=Gordonibacter massiliensis (ex Traore et al. 2017) TaxID=1841863 RepID=UPI001C8B542C|nr:hypothetical protein [Gordonibacter massiliensis (ex Traore et al. 2017)]MBX9032670.1 hypothetical protein [Gordonibacter massiliensis (ex Traore et al. 2017)]
MHEVDYTSLETLERRMGEYGQGCGRVVDGVLHGEGANIIKRAVPGLINPSGRKWPGKTASIAGKPGGASRLSQDNGSLQVTVAARGRLGYLYFPDDGTSTRKHAGNQRFMLRGAESKQSDIIDRCIAGLVDDFNQ